MTNEPAVGQKPTLQRRLGLALLVLYGTGITVGAGIYVLVGTVAAHAGVYAPWSFLVAAAVMALTVTSYAELSTHYPVSAGEAAYVRAAFNSRALSTTIGLITIATGVVSSAAVTLGAAGYIQQFLELPQELIAVLIVLGIAAIAAWGILESVLIASLFTLIEVGGLIIVITAGFHAGLPVIATIANVPPLDQGLLKSVGFGGLLAFFAFIGFEDLANVVEEAKAPHRNIPRAMILTLTISTILYVLVAAVAISAGPIERLASSPAPLSLVFREIAGVSPATITAIAIVATMNTILAQMTMAARVVYGIAREGELPGIFATVHPRSRTPLIATATVAALVIPLTLLVPIAKLAESTSLATLAVFALVNLALLRLRYLGLPSNPSHIRVPIWMPAMGLVTCIAMMAVSLVK